MNRYVALEQDLPLLNGENHNSMALRDSSSNIFGLLKQ
jgi:hypothetical protein